MQSLKMARSYLRSLENLPDLKQISRLNQVHGFLFGLQRMPKVFTKDLIVAMKTHLNKHYLTDRVSFLAECLLNQ